MQQTQAVIVKGQPWALPANLSEADITRRLNTDDWDYALPDHDSDCSTVSTVTADATVTTPSTEASETLTDKMTGAQNSRHDPL